MAGKGPMTDAEIRKFYKALTTKARDGFKLTPPKGEKHSADEVAKAELSMRYMKCIADKCTEEDFVKSLATGDIPPVKLSRQDMAFVNGGELTIGVKLPGVEIQGTISDYQQAGQQTQLIPPLAYWQGPRGQRESDDYGECIVTYWTHWPWIWG